MHLKETNEWIKKIHLFGRDCVPVECDILLLVLTDWLSQLSDSYSSDSSELNQQNTISLFQNYFTVLVTCKYKH